MFVPPVKAPVNLSSSEWKKREITTVLTKKKTGIFEALQKFEAVYSGWVGWGYLGRDVLAKSLNDLKKGGNYLNMIDVLKYYKESAVFMGNLRHHLDEVRKLADIYAREFKDTLLVPKATREFLEKMSQDCTTFPAAVEADLENRGKFIRSTVAEVGKKDPTLLERLHV